MTLTEQQSGQSFELPANSAVTIRLKENPTTGHRWTLESSDGLQPAGSEFEPGKTTGAGGIRVFQFRVPASGSHELRLHLGREWEGDKSIADRFTATVNVK